MTLQSGRRYRFHDASPLADQQKLRNAGVIHNETPNDDPGGDAPYGSQKVLIMRLPPGVFGIEGTAGGEQYLYRYDGVNNALNLGAVMGTEGKQITTGDSARLLAQTNARNKQFWAHADYKPAKRQTGAAKAIIR